MADMAKDGRVTEYMKACMSRAASVLQGKAQVQFVAMGYKEKKPDGMYKTTRVLSGKKKISNLLGLKVVDSQAEGTMFLIVNYNPLHEDLVKRSIDSLCGVDEKRTFSESDNPYLAVVAELDLYVDMLMRNVEHVRRLRKGPVKRTNGMYHDGLHVCSTNEDGIGVIAVEGGYGMPIYLSAVKGKGQELENRLRQGKY